MKEYKVGELVMIYGAHLGIVSVVYGDNTYETLGTEGEATYHQYHHLEEFMKSDYTPVGLLDDINKLRQALTAVKL